MTIYLINHNFKYETENLCRLFFQNAKFEFRTGMPDFSETDYIYTEKKEGQDGCTMLAKVCINSEISENTKFVHYNTPEFTDECERELTALLFNSLSSITGIRPKWGIITGVRPVKLLRTLIGLYGEDDAKKYYKDKLLCSEKKLNLAMETMHVEEKILNLSCKKSVSLYISIPFCPSRCSYCSFVSQSIEKAKYLIPDYVKLLCNEIELTVDMIIKLGLKLETIYIGGGTPTSLDADSLELIMNTINRNIDISEVREFTVEAGRPDTITKEKLKILKDGQVTRISINPQTFNDEILKAIGRNHTAQDIVKSFNMARNFGFNNINMDIIVGLPLDDNQSFKNTLSCICNLDPEGVTVHTLSLKRASSLTLAGEKLDKIKAALGENMMNTAQQKLKEHNYSPYYLYRQSCMVDNLENVGWSKKGFECLYNIYIMDETHSIFACGAGAVTKVKNQTTGKLERIFNYKFPYEYIKDFEKMIIKKGRISEIYDEF